MTNLVQDTIDWFLPIEHEKIHTLQFLQGGRTFIDVGAHVGTWTLRLAPLFERVFCFEPDPRGYNALRKNIQLAGLTNVEVIPKAVADKAGHATLSLYPNPCTNTLMHPELVGRTASTDRPDGTLRVETVSIDDFCAERGIDDVSLIKIDAEAAELLVVMGALKTLRGQRPDFFIEMHAYILEPLRKLLDFAETDFIDGNAFGMSLVRHRERHEWAPYAAAGAAIYPHGSAPEGSELEAIKARQALVGDALKVENFLTVKA